VVLALNLAMSAANGFRYPSHPVPVAVQPGRTPGPETKDHFEAVAASAVAQLTPAPDAGAVGRLFFETKEHR
jgi:hypothetical protein